MSKNGCYNSRQIKICKSGRHCFKGNYLDLPIYVRARDRQLMAYSEKAGATAVVSEAAESSLQLGSVVLSSLDVSVDEIASVIQEYREDDYKRLEEIISGG